MTSGMTLATLRDLTSPREAGHCLSRPKRERLDGHRRLTSRAMVAPPTPLPTIAKSTSSVGA